MEKGNSSKTPPSEYWNSFSHWVVGDVNKGDRQAFCRECFMLFRYNELEEPFTENLRMHYDWHIYERKERPNLLREYWMEEARRKEEVSKQLEAERKEEWRQICLETKKKEKKEEEEKQWWDEVCESADKQEGPKKEEEEAQWWDEVFELADKRDGKNKK